jgi:GAF domain-containing protein
MSENLIIPETADRATRYEALLPQIRALISGEPDLIANLANIAAALKEGFGFFWVGFYLVKGNQLVLGPFQGPIACTRISFGRGVCGSAWKERQTVLVPDVDKFPGHIACSSLSKSEIVVPGIRQNEVFLVLDVDSDRVNDFSATDQQHLEQLMSWIEQMPQS